MNLFFLQLNLVIYGQIVLDLTVAPKISFVEKWRATVTLIKTAKKAINVEMTTVQKTKGFLYMLIAALKVHTVLNKNTSSK